MIRIGSELSGDPLDDEPLTAPCLGFHNLATTDTITVASDTDDNPGTNLGNPSTNLLWEASSAVAQLITVDTSDYGDVIDYLGVVGHNFGTEHTTVSVEISVSGSWIVAVEAFLPEDDSPIIFRFFPETLDGVRLRMEPLVSASPMRAAAIYVGKLLVFERGVQPFTPFPFGRMTTVTNGFSQNGNFLGNIITGSRVESTASFVSLTAAWYRSTLDAFCQVATEKPFFFSWRPLTYPDEVGYAWLTADPIPEFDIDGYVAIDFNMTGVVA